MAKTSRITEPNTFDFEYSLFLPMIRKYDCSAWYKKLVSTPTDKIIKKYLEFEKEFGNTKTFEHVKNLAQKLVTEKLTKLSTEEDMNVD